MSVLIVIVLGFLSATIIIAWIVRVLWVTEREARRAKLDRASEETAIALARAKILTKDADQDLEKALSQLPPDYVPPTRRTPTE